MDGKEFRIGENAPATYEGQLRAKRAQVLREEPEYVQAFITNVVSPKTLDELYERTTDGDYCPTMDTLLYMFRGEPVEWTVPRWAKVSDVAFFMHSKTSNSNLTSIRTELGKRKAEFSSQDYRWLKYWVNHELDVYKLYGGKIFAVGRVVGKPYVEADQTEDEHWKSRVYARIDDIQVLKNPIDISQFNDFIFISRQGAITPVLGKEYDQLMDHILVAGNKLPKQFKGLKCDPLPLPSVNADNWFDITQRYRRAFFLESQFRSYCVDYFLRTLGDRKTFYSEGRCKKRGRPDTFVDNLVLLRGKWLPVEVKLDIEIESDLNGQLRQYMNVNSVVVSKTRRLNRKELWLDRVLVVDTEGLYLYADDTLRYLLLWDDVASEEQLLAMLNARLDEVCSW